MYVPALAGGDDAAPALGGLHDKADPHLRSLNEVTGYNIHASDGRIGHVETFLLDDATLEIRYLVASTRN